MKAFKIIDKPSTDNRTKGVIVAQNVSDAYDQWEKRCLEMDLEEDYDCVVLHEMTREEYNSIRVADDMQEPDENGDYPLIEGSYDSDVETATTPYVIEFNH